MAHPGQAFVKRLQPPQASVIVGSYCSYACWLYETPERRCCCTLGNESQGLQHCQSSNLMVQATFINCKHHQASSICLQLIHLHSAYDFAHRGNRDCSKFSKAENDCHTAGEIFYFEYDLLQKPLVSVGCLDQQGTLLREYSVDMITSANLMHDFALTENYIILYESPMRLDVKVSCC